MKAKKLFRYAMPSLAVCVLMFGCQKKDRPGLGDFPKDSNPPGGPLNFYLAFDGTTSNAAMNAVDSIRANFPASNPLTSTTGISGKAVKGEAKKYIKFAKPNDWVSVSKSFTIAFWFKRDGQTKNNTGTNGPEHIMSMASTIGSWSEGTLMVFLEGNNTACGVKLFVVDKNATDSWLTWEGGNAIAGLLDNAWHHLAFVYDAATSKLTLYKDGVANGFTPQWGSHGDIAIDNSKVTELKIGAGPGTKYDTDDWLSSTFKGELDQFRLYSKPLNSGEVSALVASKL